MTLTQLLKQLPFACSHMRMNHTQVYVKPARIENRTELNKQRIVWTLTRAGYVVDTETRRWVLVTVGTFHPARVLRSELAGLIFDFPVQAERAKNGTLRVCAEKGTPERRAAVEAALTQLGYRYVTRGCVIDVLEDRNGNVFRKRSLKRAA